MTLVPKAPPVNRDCYRHIRAWPRNSDSSGEFLSSFVTLSIHFLAFVAWLNAAAEMWSGMSIFMNSVSSGDAAMFTAPALPCCSMTRLAQTV